ncbi:MAG: hypothetical protein RL538_186 [Candidatus Parcubacteria bacterium]|jgi:hypothetical protein
MFANATFKVDISQRVVATLVASAMLLATIGYHSVAQAANFEFISDTLSDSGLSAQPSHTIEFTVPTGSSIGAGDLITINFVGFSDVVTNVDLADITATVNGGAVTEGGYTESGTQFSFNGVTATGGDDIVVVVAAANITNPGSTGSYEIQITTPSDYGETEVAIVDVVEVTAAVDTSFTFIVEGLATSTTIGATTTTGSTTATVIAFGQLVAGVSELLGQRLNVITNAKNGFDVTVESDSDLASANGADIDSFSMGTDLSTPTAWSDPVTNISNENTWGHWGVTTEDNAGLFDDGEYIAVSSTTARSIFSHTGPADGSTVDMGETDVAYKIRISALQEAADDYNTTLTYIATPTF